MNKVAISKIQQAIWALQRARELVVDADIGDAGQFTIESIDELIEDLDADLLYLNNGEPVVKS